MDEQYTQWSWALQDEEVIRDAVSDLSDLLAALQRFVWDKSRYSRIEHGSDPQVWYCKHCYERWLASEPEKHNDGCRIKQAHAAIAKAKEAK